MKPSPSFVSTDFILEFDRLKEENKQLKKEKEQMKDVLRCSQYEYQLLRRKCEKLKEENNMLKDDLRICKEREN